MQIISTSWILWICCSEHACIYLFEILLSFPLDIYPKVEFLDQKVILFLVFWSISILFSIVTAQIDSPTISESGFPFLYISNTC